MSVFLKSHFIHVIIIISFLSACHKRQNNINNCVPLELQEGLVAFYPFGEGSLLDISGNENHLTNKNKAIVAEDRGGNQECSYFFSDDNFFNTNSYLSMNNPDFLNGLDSFSISSWYKYKVDISTFGWIRPIISRDTAFLGGFDKRGQWSLSLFDLARGVFSENTPAWTNSATSKAEWNHLVGVKANNEISIYLNGQLHEQSVYDPNIIDPRLHIAEDLGDLFIGYGFLGYIDDVMIFDKALSNSEIESLFGLEPCCE